MKENNRLRQGCAYWEEKHCCVIERKHRSDPWDSSVIAIFDPGSVWGGSTQESTWAAEATELLGQGSFGSSSSARRRSGSSVLCLPSLPEESSPAVTPGTQERAGLPGVLTEANRLTGGTSSSQRQLEHLTPEIARHQKVNIRILLTETKTIQLHQNPVLPPQWVLDTLTYWKSKIQI